MMITDEMKIGWNACRRQVYLLAEYEQDTGPYSADMSDFARGYKYMAKSFAKAFNAFEAEDCDFLREAALSSAHPAPAQEVETDGLVLVPKAILDKLFKEMSDKPRPDYITCAGYVAELHVLAKPVSPSTDKLALAREALRPFDAMSVALFTRNWNNSDVVFETLKKDGHSDARLTAGDFFAVRAALSTIEES